ncbi:MAG: BON domain-containing protein [Xanthomonadales bacterium]|nr:BON domain-containing protein [Xanthomonadales bacterium]
MKAIKPALAGMLAISVLQGCAAVAAGAVVTTIWIANDDRTTGTLIDDQGIQVQALNELYALDEIGDQDRIKVESYNGVVLLIGEVTDESKKELATRTVQPLGGVRRVVNELAIQEQPDLGDRSEDRLLSTRVNSALATNNTIKGFDATRVSVSTARNTVYLMGLVTRAEGDAVTEVVRNVRGVERVVKVFEYTD